METKKCNKCLKVKSVLFFGKESRSKNGYKPRCKECTNEYYNSMYANNLSMRTKKSQTSKVRYINNRDVLVEKSSNYAKKNRKRINEYMKRYRANTDYFDKQNEYAKEKYQNDPEYRANKKLRRLVSRIVTNKTEATCDILKFSTADLKKYLGRLPDMGECLDHKIPISWFKPDTPPSISSHLFNLQIASQQYNCKKGNRYSDSVTFEYFNIAKHHIKHRYIKKVKHHGKQNSLEDSP